MVTTINILVYYLFSSSCIFLFYIFRFFNCVIHFSPWLKMLVPRTVNEKESLLSYFCSFSQPLFCPLPPRLPLLCTPLFTGADAGLTGCQL